jgi:hypothetical protein
MKRLRRNNPHLPSHSRWLAYATAGAATALGGLASAEAEIHYSGRIDVVLPGHLRQVSATQLPLSNGASVELSNFVQTTSDYNVASFRVLGAAVSHSFRADEVTTFLVKRLPKRPPTLVSQGVFHRTNPIDSSNIHGPYNSQWAGEGFIGFKFNTGAGTQYGWVRMKIQRDPLVGMKVRDYAWADPGEPIKTGQTSSSDDHAAALPDEGSLGLLALGGAGLMGWRNRRRLSQIAKSFDRRPTAGS